jgi:TRAP-type C4-dicarboxylate transport system substrate-binding protein
MTRNIRSVLVAAASLGFISGTAAAQEITLRVADSLPVDHYIANYTVKPWMEAVTAATDGRVAFEYFPAEQIGKAKDLLALTTSGVADIGYVAPSYVSDKMPLSAVAQLPGAFGSACEGTEAYYDLATGGIIAEQEMATNDVRLLLTVVAYPYQVFTSNRPIDGLESLEGLKLRTTGGAMDIMARKVGAAPIQMAGPEVYDSLSRGTLDGLVFPYSGVLGYHLESLVKWGTQDLNFGSFAYNYVISEKKFQSLPEDVQKIMIDLGAKQTSAACRSVDGDVKPDMEKLRQAGVTFATLSEEARAEIGRAIEPVTTEWAADLDRRGKPGTEVLQAFRSALEDGKGS